MTRVLVLAFTEIAGDVRVRRHVEALLPAHEVTTCGAGAGVDGAEHLGFATGTPIWPMTPGYMSLQAVGAAEAAYWRSPAVVAARARLGGSRFDLVLCNDIETLPLALAVADGAPVLADLHEYAPEQFAEDWRWRLVRRRFLNRLCARYLPRATAVMTASPGYGTEYQRVYGIAPPETIINASSGRRPAFRPTGDPIRVVHSGIGTRNRQIERMVDAASDIAGITLDLLLPARNPRDRAYVAELTARAAATTNVRVVPPVPLEGVPEALDAYDVGIFVLPPTTAHKALTLPNKIYEWLQSGLGVIVGPSPVMGRVVQDLEIGMVTESFETADIRRALVDLDAAAVDGWKRRAVVAAQTETAEREAERLRALVGRLLS